MKRSNSLQLFTEVHQQSQLQQHQPNPNLLDSPSSRNGNVRISGIPNCKSLPNIDMLNGTICGKKAAAVAGVAAGLKRQNSKRVKLFQKTWAAVKTIIHPSAARRGSKTKQQPLEDQFSPRTASPSASAKKSPITPNTSVPSTPNRKHQVFDFNFDNNPVTGGAHSLTCQQQQHQSTSLTPSPLTFSDPKPFNYCCGSGTTGFTKRSQSIEIYEDDQVIRNYVELQKRLSDELHQAILHKEEKKKEEVLSEEFKKRLQQWDMWKASTGKYHYTDEELRQLIPSDFSKKLQEWEYIKTRPRDESQQLLLHQQHEISPLSSAQGSGCGRYYDGGESSAGSTAAGKKIQRKKKNSEASRQKELAWLQKQLEKIECEKKRLEREMKKYCERELRLEKMREALKNSPGPKEEVWIKTPTAECKVEGIDEKFTKKLYKWEAKQGIEPESSTMALLNPKYFTPSPDQPQVSDNIELNLPETNSDHEADQCGLHEHDHLRHGQEHDISKRDYTSSDESEQADCEYEEATDSFATKDESRASGASNTDSECFNLKPVSGYRRRSSDAISTPMSTQSLSGCTSDDEENFMLKTVNENEEDKITVESLEAKQPIFKAKPTILMDEDGETDERSSIKYNELSNVIVPTKRTIFKPVVDLHLQEPQSPTELEELRNVVSFRIENLVSPKLIKNIAEQMSIPLPNTPNNASSSRKISHGTSFPFMDEEAWKDSTDGPKIVGMVRKKSDASASTVSEAIFGPRQSTSSSPIQISIPTSTKSPTAKTNGGMSPKQKTTPPVSFSPPRPNFPKMGGKIPVWCSPMMARRKIYPAKQSPPIEDRFKPTDFSIDKFLEEFIPPNTRDSPPDKETLPGSSKNTHNAAAMPPVPIRPSRIPVTSPNLMQHRKYTIAGGFPTSKDNTNEFNINNEKGKVKLIGLTRSCSFQGSTKRQQQQMQNQDLGHLVSAGGQGTQIQLAKDHEPTSHPLPSSVTATSTHAVISNPSSPNGTSVAKSKSTGSILGNCNIVSSNTTSSSNTSSKGLFGFATKFGLGNSTSSTAKSADQKGTTTSKLLPAWLRHSSSSSNVQKK